MQFIYSEIIGEWHTLYTLELDKWYKVNFNLYYDGDNTYGGTILKVSRIQRTKGTMVGGFRCTRWILSVVSNSSYSKGLPEIREIQVENGLGTALYEVFPETFQVY